MSISGTPSVRLIDSSRGVLSSLTSDLEKIFVPSITHVRELKGAHWKDMPE